MPIPSTHPDQQSLDVHKRSNFGGELSDFLHLPRSSRRSGKEGLKVGVEG